MELTGIITELLKVLMILAFSVVLILYLFFRLTKKEIKDEMSHDEIKGNYVDEKQLEKRMRINERFVVINVTRQNTVDKN